MIKFLFSQDAGHLDNMSMSRYSWSRLFPFSLLTHKHLEVYASQKTELGKGEKAPGSHWAVALIKQYSCPFVQHKCCCLLSIDTESSLFFLSLCLTLKSVPSVRARSICPDPLPHRLLWGILRPLLLRLLVSSTLCLFWHADVCKITDAVGSLKLQPELLANAQSQ